MYSTPRTYVEHWIRRTSAAVIALLLVVGCFVAPRSATAEPLTSAMMTGQGMADAKLAMTESLTPAGQYPFYTIGDRWGLNTRRGWTSGFLSGAHWLDFQRTHRAASRDAAQQRQATLAPSAFDTNQHDIGFMLLSSYGNGYRITGDTAFREVLLTAARSLSTRYSPVVGSVRTNGTPYPFTVYNDTMMNIELLFWGANNGGGSAMREQAKNHALRCVTDFIRPDGSTYHYVAYDENTGRILDKGQGQGFADESTWSRGQAWVIYGLSVAYRETGDARFLHGAHRATDYWVANVPTDLIPYWDFDAPGIPNTPRDTSAASAVASAFIELSRLDPDPVRRASYLDLSVRTLDSLSSPAYLAPATNPAVLAHGTYAYMVGAYDHGTSWGDYYYREALTRYRTQVRRSDGPDRYAVSIRSSQTGFTSADTVIIASGERFPDALSASGLAGAMAAPVLLTRPDTLGGGIAAEIARLGATEAIIIGGPEAVGAPVERSLDAIAGVNVRRIGGADRYQVSIRVADEIGRANGTPVSAMMVRGDDFADALSISALAYAEAVPVLLTRPDELPAECTAYLQRTRPAMLTIAGGTSAISDTCLSAATLASGGSARRLAGADRYQTAAAIARDAIARGASTTSVIGIATGVTFADALSGGPVIGSSNGVMLLTRGSILDPAAKSVLEDASTLETIVRIFGGTTAVSGRVENEVKNALREQ